MHEEEALKKSDPTEKATKVPSPGPEEKSGLATEAGKEEGKMEVDEPVTQADKEGEPTPPTTESQPADLEKKDTSEPMQADEDDAVEY